MKAAMRFDVVGCDGPKTYFGRLTRESLAHGYLFTGLPGVGKKTFARRLAQSLLCEAPAPGLIGYDGTCPSCLLFERGGAQHPDFLEHDGQMKIGDPDAAAGFYGAEELTARDLVRQLSMQSYSGGLRVLLLGDIEFATHHAANALLKFFEEPPRNVVLILTTSAAGRLLTTIRSRLIELRFPPLSMAQAAEVLRAIGYDPNEAELGAALAQGSIARAVAALGGDEETFRADVAGWFFDVVAGSSPEGSWAARDTLDEGLEILKSLVRDWIAVHLQPPARATAVDYVDELRRLPAPGATALAALAKIDEAQRLARTNVSPAMVAEMVRMNLTGLVRASV